jgi:monoterpene epsilon-lactone hydrolase
LTFGDAELTLQNEVTDLASQQAQKFWNLFRGASVKQIDLPLAQRREAGEHAEDSTAEPFHTKFTAAPEVEGLWATPEHAEQDAAILYLFGGGYVLGSPASRRKTAGHLGEAAAARVLVPNYRLAPEHPFPAAIDDAVAAYQFLIDYGAEPKKTVIAGDSAGGGLAIATLLALRDRGLPRPAGGLALSPWADLTCSGETMVGKAKADLECTREGLLQMAGWYLAGADPKSPLASPVFADFTGLSPILCVVGGDEVLIDDSVRLIRAAGLANVDATLFIASGMQHVFPIWDGDFPEADAAIRMTGDWIKRRTAPA